MRIAMPLADAALLVWIRGDSSLDVARHDAQRPTLRVLPVFIGLHRVDIPRVGPNALVVEGDLPVQVDQLDEPGHVRHLCPEGIAGAVRANDDVLHTSRGRASAYSDASGRERRDHRRDDRGPEHIAHRRVLREQQTADHRTNDRSDSTNAERPADASRSHARGVELRRQRMRRVLAPDDPDAGACDSDRQQRH